MMLMHAMNISFYRKLDIHMRLNANLIFKLKIMMKTGTDMNIIFVYFSGETAKNPNTATPLI